MSRKTVAIHSKSMKIALAMLILAMSLMQSPVLADGNTGIVRGTVVRSDNGKPISDASVFWVTPSGIGSTKTNATGRFYFLNVSPGLTAVSSIKFSFSPGCFQGVTHANETVDVVIRLAPASRRLDGNRCRPLHATGHEAVEDSR